jgi:hypothetical protein
MKPKGSRLIFVTRIGMVVGVALSWSVPARADDISGTISSTFTIFNNSRLVDCNS